MKKIRKAFVCLLFFALTALGSMTALANDDIVIVGTDGEEVAEDTVQNGVYIGNISVGGMTRSQVGEAIDEYINTLNGMQLTVQSEKGSTEIAIADMSLTCNNRDEIAEAAIGEQHLGNLIAQYKQAKDLESNNLHLELDLSIDASALASYLISQIPELESSPVNASMYRDDNGNFVFVDSVDGFTIDYDGTYEAVIEALKNYDGTSGSVVADVVGTATAATYDISVFDGFGDVLGEWSTNYSCSSENYNRATNIRIASSKINGTVLMPGETFSFCTAVQPFTAAEGYLEAGTYKDGETVDDLGGGVCQVSSTLYNAVLWAELDVVYRSSHSKTVTYVDYSMDAMVYVANGADFQFTNSTDHAIYIESYITSSSELDYAGGPTEDITFRIYGTEYRAANRTIEYESIIIEEEWPDPVYNIVYDDSLDMYEYAPDHAVTYNVTLSNPHKMIKAKLVKHVYIDGVEDGDPIYIHTDTYKMESGTLAINSKTTIVDIEYDDDLGIIKLDLSNVYLDAAEATTTTKTTEEATTEEETEEETTKAKETTKATTTAEETTTKAAETTKATTTAAETTTKAAETTTAAEKETTTTAEAEAEEASAEKSD